VSHIAISVGNVPIKYMTSLIDKAIAKVNQNELD
jgi:hypothetical protein